MQLDFPTRFDCEEPSLSPSQPPGLIESTSLGAHESYKQLLNHLKRGLIIYQHEPHDDKA